MALFSRKKKPGADQRELLERLDGRELQTVTRRDPETSAETVIGKGRPHQYPPRPNRHCL